MAYKFFLTMLLAGLLVSCVKDTITEPEKTESSPPSLAVSFKAMANNKELLFKNGWYSNSSGDGFSVAILNYYITNVKLTRNDGWVYSEPESYHLIRHAKGIQSFTIANLPEGTYTNIEFLVGVDSLRNVSGAQTGALDPANDMFWDWNTGYRFFVMEGSYTSSAVPDKSDYAIHIGGFSGPYSCLQNARFNLAVPLVAQLNRQSNLYYNTVIDEVFKNPAVIGFDDYYASVGLPMFKAISVNYKDMFVVDRTEN